MTMSAQDKVAAAIRFFFDTALPSATGKHWGDLHDPRCHLGTYATYSGAAVPTAFGPTITPKYVLNVSRRALAAPGGRPDAQGASVGSDVEPRHLLWLRHAADAKVDSAEEIARVMADIDSFAHVFEAPASGAAPATPGAAPAAPATSVDASAPAWGAAIASAAVRSALPDNLAQLTTVPSGLSALVSTVPQLHAVLRHFFTYNDGGAYYPRWVSPSGTHDPAVAAQLGDAYKRENVREVRLERNQVYLYAVVPQSLLTGQGDQDTSIFREVVIRFDETDDSTTPFTLATVHTAQWRRNVGPHEDFVFFYTDVGEGLPLAPQERGKLNAPLAQFLRRYLASVDQRDAVLARGRNVVRRGGAAYVNVIAAVEGNVTFPDGVLQFDTRRIRRLAIPVDKVADVARLPGVKRLSVLYQPRRNCDLIRTAIHFNDLLGRLPAAARNGQGVLVGVIDSGIDGSHPDFGNRLIAFWDQGDTPLVAGPTPHGAHPANAAYDAWDYGVELQRAPLAPASPNSPSTAQDDNEAGHGTHVTGIAAGSGVPDPAHPGSFLVPPGFAGQAMIAVVRAIEVGNQPSIVDGIDWIFQKATELNVPCVINMSFGHHGHPHDGTDDESLRIFTSCVDATGAYLPGRILVASAGNERTDHIHMRRSVPAHGNADFPVQIGPFSFARIVQLWIKNPNPANDPNAPFPVDVIVSGSSLRRNTPISVTNRVRIGTDAVNPPFLAHRTQIEINTRRAGDLSNRDYMIEVIFTTTDPAPAPGSNLLQLPMLEETWTIRLSNQTGAALDAHAWALLGCRLPTSIQPDDEAFLVGVPAVGPATVSVAANVTRQQWQALGADNALHPSAAGINNPNPPELAAFSSPGPLRFASVQPEAIYGVTHEINAIDVAAPGAHTWSARSSQIPANSLAELVAEGLIPNDKSLMLSGTSMAAPVITGLIANILADTPTLTLPQVLDRLHRASHIPASSNFQQPGPGGQPGGTPPGHPGYSRDWGYGLVNAPELKP